MFTFQEIDQTAMAAPVTKGSWLVHDTARIPEYVATAFRTAMSGRPGPVHLTLPIDLQEAVISEDDLPKYMPREYRNMGRAHGDPAGIEEAAALLRGAERPVIIAGNPARVRRRRRATGSAGRNYGGAGVHGGAGAGAAG